MPTLDPRIDAYIQKAQPFAQPILKTIRARVHAVCPDAVETMKWSFPHFDYQGKILASMAAFKAHAAMNIWSKAEFEGRAAGPREAMGMLGKLTSVKDLPSAKELQRRLAAAMKAIEHGEAAYSRPRGAPKKPLVVPRALLAELQDSKKAFATWSGFSDSHKREYVEWIGEAKTEPTREKRIAQMLEWLAEGKPRNWKYGR
jgi:uncharacterized protein YdeI (YjbR/CyaY-like superfamily)